ncbi:MAG: flagellar basal body rod protein FlgC [Alphaproteobacteria bacterium]|nr:flagellar basal body rod protein FlgC [Alphaproteobacteria bacterium]
MDDMMKTMRLSAAGMKAQGARLRVISENIANADSLPTDPGKQPYRRRVVSFRNELDKSTGLPMVRANRVREDKGDFPQRYDPGHPAADANGYVRTPNVNTLIETMDMREAQRSYDANLNVLKASKTMLQHTIDILRR